MREAIPPGESRPGSSNPGDQPGDNRELRLPGAEGPKPEENFSSMLLESAPTFFAERIFRSVVENTHASLVIVSEDFLIIYANSRFRQLVDRPLTDLTGLNAGDVLKEVIDSKTLGFLKRRARRLMKGKSVPSCFTIKTGFRGSESRWFEVRSGLITTTEGHKRIVAQFLDITKQLQAQRELEESEARYRSLVESAPIGIICVDREGRIIEVNPKLLEILGSPSAQATKSINMLSFPPLVQSGISENFAKCFESGDSLTFETPYQSKWGKKSYLRYSLTPLQRYADRVVMVQAVVEDITEQKRLEAEIIHSQKMEALGTMAGGIAHEFNNLLQIIQGYAEILSFDQDYARNRSLELREIRIATRRAAELTQQVLTFSRKIESRRVPLRLNDEVHRTARVLEQTTLKLVPIDLRLAEDLKTVSADPDQIRQVLTNLALNARDALPPEGRINIRTENVTLDRRFCQSRLGLTAGEYVRLSFADNGSGMDLSTLNQIYDPFFTTKKVGQGVGLGLSIVYGIIRDHGGHIECHSSPKEGTTFDIYFPVYPCAGSPASGREPPPPHPQLPAGGAETILLVDDEPTLRKLGAEFLSRFGYTVLSAAEGDSALRLFKDRQEQVELVILDLIMPPHGGEWCLRQMLATKPEQKVIVASGYASNTTVHDILRAGASGFLRKPYKLRELLLTVREALDSTD
jgi:two-component system cell cycle sensor histidine kinase/response regulator CckA